MMRCFSTSRLAVLSLLLLLPASLLARLQMPEGTEDLQWLASGASYILHAQVVDIRAVTRVGNPPLLYATLAVDRWYKGEPKRGQIQLEYSFSEEGYGFGGHDCIDLHRSPSWLIFATRSLDGNFHFSHDCEGGLPMSAMLAPLTKSDWARQLQLDLIAGLKDEDPLLRLANIARLGGLKMKSSTPALQTIIEHGSALESKWAIYAVIRSGDISVLPWVEEIVISELESQPAVVSSERYKPGPAPSGFAGKPAVPDRLMPLSIKQIRDPEAVPALIRILDNAPSELVRSCASQALAEIKDPRSAPVSAKHLSDDSRYVRYDSLGILMSVTHAPECTLPKKWEEADIPATVARCKQWWETTGKNRDWTN